MTKDDKKEAEAEEVVTEESAEPEKIKLGDEEYTQNELNSLVGLGKIAKEAEEKYNVKVEGIWPKFQQTINENVEYRKNQEEKEKLERNEEITKKAQEGAELTEAEQLELAKNKLKEMGFISRGDIEKEVSAVIEGRDLLDNVNKLVEDQATAGNPKTSSEDLLTYMQENGIKSPNIAYKLMFEEELDAIKEKKLGGMKKEGFVTEGGQSAGGKSPTAKPLTRANLTEALSEVLNRES